MIKNNRKAFTMLELIFVIVIMGILAKFGVALLAQAYRSFIFSNINNKLQAKSAYAVEMISKRLEHRIKLSVIYRDTANGSSDVNFAALETGTDENATILEWIGADIEGYRAGNWSGVIDLNASESNANKITSLSTNTTDIDNLIKILSDGNSTINDAAIYFVGGDRADDKWGWDGNKTEFNTQDNINIHPIRKSSIASETNIFYPVNSYGVDNNFSNVEAFEYYKLAWSAYAISLEDYNTSHNLGTNMGDLYLYYNYQPWKGEQYDDAGIGVKKVLLQDKVSSCQFRTAGSLIKIQVCSKDTLIKDEEYSICKEKTVY
jgi:prepilin-type N-terminal cleavage/methylation domain-containing protein